MGFGFEDYFYTTRNYGGSYAFPYTALWYKFMDQSSTDNYQVGDTLSVWTMGNYGSGVNRENVNFELLGAT